MNDLNDLMSRIDEINAKSATELTPSDIDDVIKYHRQMRNRKASGEKPTRSKSTITLDQIMAAVKPAEPKKDPIVRRF